MTSEPPADRAMRAEQGMAGVRTCELQLCMVGSHCLVVGKLPVVRAGQEQESDKLVE